MTTAELKKHLHPSLEINDKGTQERLNKLLFVRQAFIQYAAQKEGLSYSEALAFVDKLGGNL